MTYSRVIVAVQGVSLKVPDNSIVALLGTNGAGKSTTVRAISGFLPVDDAEIKKGIDPLRWRFRSWGCRRTRSRARASYWCRSVARFSRRSRSGTTCGSPTGDPALARHGAKQVDRLFEIFPGSGFAA